MTRNVHDHLAKEVFRRPDEARTLFRAFLPLEQLEALDLDSLLCVPGGFVDEQLKSRHSDLLFSVRCRDAPLLVYLLFEHKSSQDRWLVLQLLVYVTRIWTRWRKEHGEDCRLPMILPVVLYHGERRWSQPLRLIDLCDPEGRAAELLGPGQPTLPLTLIDLSQLTEQQIESACAQQSVEKAGNAQTESSWSRSRRTGRGVSVDTASSVQRRDRPRGPDCALHGFSTGCQGTAAATLTMLLMKSIRGKGLVHRLRSWIPVVRRAREETGGRQTLELLVQYVLLGAHEEVDVDELQDVLSLAVGPEAEELVMNTGEKLIRKGEEQGLQKGRQEGMREALASVLRTRFGGIPETVRAQMEGADLEALQRWHGRAVIVESVDEVFGTC